MDRRAERAVATCIRDGEAVCTIQEFARLFAARGVGAQHAAPLQRKPRPSEEKDLTQRSRRPEPRVPGEITAATERKRGETEPGREKGRKVASRGTQLP